MIRLFSRRTFEKENYNKGYEIIKKLVEESQKEEGCIEYDVFFDVDLENSLCIYEEWEDENALNKHSNSEHFKKYVPMINELTKEKSPLYRFK